MNPRKEGRILAAFLIAFLPLALAQGTYTQFDVPGAIYTFVAGIDSAGDVVGQYEDASGNFHGFFFSGSTYATVDYPGVTSGTQCRPNCGRHDRSFRCSNGVLDREWKKAETDRRGEYTECNRGGR